MLKNSGWVPTYFSNSSDAKFTLRHGILCAEIFGAATCLIFCLRSYVHGHRRRNIESVAVTQPQHQQSELLGHEFCWRVKEYYGGFYWKASQLVGSIFIFIYLFIIFFYFFAKAQHKPISMSLRIVRFCWVRLADLLTEQLSNHAYAQQGCAQNARSKKQSF